MIAAMEKHEITHLVIHCSDSAFGELSEVRRWHTQPEKCPHGFKRAKGCPVRCNPNNCGNGWAEVGYHFVIHNAHPYTTRETDPMFDGLILPGRTERQEGAHAPGYNARSLGVCLIGKSVFTPQQRRSLHNLVQMLRAKYGIPIEQVIGHCETEYERAKPERERKTCPNIDMKAFRRELGA